MEVFHKAKCLCNTDTATSEKSRKGHVCYTGSGKLLHTNSQCNGTINIPVCPLEIREISETGHLWDRELKQYLYNILWISTELDL